tara:strand:+ start:4317 stop:8390 length:4074 start_codon:yes stop_codon:yes gene_type:complete
MTEDLTLNNPEEVSSLSNQQAESADLFMESGARLEAEHQEQKAFEEETGITAEAIEAASKDQGFLPNNPLQLAQEAGTAVVGGLADAIESVGGFLELSGDTAKVALNRIYGNPYTDDDDVAEDQNPFSTEYKSRDAGWLDIPDQWIPQNNSGLGKLARGLAEFGFIAAATGGVGGWTAGTAKAGVRVAAAGRAAGIGRKGVKTIRLFHKGSVIATEGAIADLITNSSETYNIANLVQEHAPGVPFVDALAVDPDKDSRWTARIKTVMAGAGVNLVGHFLAAYIKAGWRGAKALKKGASPDEANSIVNSTIDNEMARASYLDEAAATERAADQWNQGFGISNTPNRKMYVADYLDEAENARYNDPITSQLELEQLDEIADARGVDDGNPWDWEQGQSARQFEESLTRKADSAVNPNLFSDADKSTYRPDSPDPGLRNLKESVDDLKAGGEGRSYEPLQTESALNRMARGDVSVRQSIVDLSKTIAREAFSELDSSLNFKEVQALIIKQAEEIYGLVEDGGEQAVKNLKAHFKKKENGIEWTHDGNTIVTGNASQKMALQLVIHSLAKQVQAISSGANQVAPTASLIRQGEQIHNAMKVAIIEHKKIGFMTGTELASQRGIKLSRARRLEIEEGLADIEIKNNAFFDELQKLFKEGKHQDRRFLSELYEHSGGKVNTLEQITDYLRAKIGGGRMDGENIPARWKMELRSVFYNSILSSLKTPIKAVAGTNMIALLRPLQAYMGARLDFSKGLGGNKQEMLLAAAQIDAYGKALAEGFEMFKHNWDLGVNRKAQTYIGRFDFDKDIENWKALKPYYDAYGSAMERTAYNALDNIVDWNNSPWLRYSANAMGAGDALARTVIGRMEMRLQAAREAIESGVDLDNVVEWANKNEELFRHKVFKQDEYNKWVVSDKATKLAGDEAAMTKALEGNLAGLERISKITGMRAFFPFVRTGYNSLRLAFGHTILNRFTAQFHDIMRGENLAKYGIANKADLASAQALMRGRMAMGNSIIAMASLAAMTGLMTGDLPRDKETRDLWRANGIKPNSFKFGLPGGGSMYVSYKDIEPFNTLLAATGNVVAHQHVLGEDMRDEMLEKLVWMTTAVVVDKSMLAGVEDLAQVLAADTAGGKLKRTAAKYIRSHLPYAGLLAQVGNVMDANEKEANTFMEQIFQRDAIFKSVFYQPKYDILAKDRRGKPLTKSSGNPMLDLFNSLSPVAVTFIGNDPVKKGLAEMSFNLPEVMTSYKGEPLNSFERSQLQKYMAMGRLRVRLEKAMKKDGIWRRELDAYKQKGLRSADGFELKRMRFYRIIKKIFEDEKRLAMNRLRMDNPSLAERIDLRQYKANLSKQGRMQAIENLMNLPK